jgi:glycosyltransferase involved in cell wall biosynthesis
MNRLRLMAEMRNRLLIVDQHQFGYLTDTFKYCTYLRDVFDITYLGWDYGDRRVTLQGLDVRYISRSGPRPVRLLRFIRAARKEMRSGNYDHIFIVYFQGASCLRWRTPVEKCFIDIRTGSDRPSLIHRWLENYLLRHEVPLFRNRSIISASLIDDLGFDRKQFHVLPLGGEPMMLPQKEFQELKLFYVGTLDQRGIHLTVEGLTRFHEQMASPVPVRYDIVGSGPAEDERLLHEAMQRSALRPHIHFHGRVPNAELRPFMERANIGVAFLPWKRYYDCQPSTKVFEYLLAGMPVIATATTENNAVINDSNGVVTPDSVEGFTDGLRRLYERRACYDSGKIKTQAAPYAWENIVLHNLLPYLQETSPRSDDTEK